MLPRLSVKRDGRAVLKASWETYDRLIVVLNVGGVMDTKLLRSIPGIDAVLLMGQAGNIGGYALADVLTGRVTPSGKLTGYPGRRIMRTTLQAGSSATIMGI